MRLLRDERGRPLLRPIIIGPEPFGCWRSLRFSSNRFNSLQFSNSPRRWVLLSRELIGLVGGRPLWRAGEANERRAQAAARRHSPSQAKSTVRLVPAALPQVLDRLGPG